jgi:class 3 adenylate cyclase/TolB-like protein
MERKLTVIFYADVAGYSRLTGVDEEGSHQRVMAVLDSATNRIEANGGMVLRYAGDAILATFPSVVRAVETSIAQQNELAAQNADFAEDQRVELRIGVNIGDVIEDRGEVYGDGVNVAARLESMAEPGGICISRAVRDQIRDRLNVPLVDKGEVAVKNITRPVRMFFINLDDRSAPGGKHHTPCYLISADISGFALLMGKADGVNSQSIDECRELFTETLKHRKGRVLDAVGHGLRASFENVSDALAAGVEAQQAIANRNKDEPLEKRIQFRVGVDLLEDVDVPAFFSEITAGPAEICVSRKIHDQLRGDDVFAFEPLGDSESGSGRFRLVMTEDSTHLGSKRLPLQCQGLDLPLPSKPSVILMPLKDLSTNGEFNYIAEGIRIDVQCALVKISGLFVIAAGSASIYGDRTVRPEQVTREMGVQYVLDGSVHGNSERVRVSVQLTDGTIGQVIWAERYDRKLDDTFAVQDEIAQRIVTSLDVQLVSGEQAKVWRKTLRNPKALELYYKGLDLLSSFDKESIAAARQLFEKVTEISPKVSLGPTCVAFCHYWDATMGWSSDPEYALDQAAEWAERAASMDDADGQGHIILAHVKLLRAQHDQALKISEAAVQIRPLCANTNALSGNILLYCGKPKKAIERVKAAIRYAPVYATWWIEILAAAYRDAGQFEMAVSAAKEAIRLRPESTSGLVILASILATEWPELAREAAARVLEQNPDFSLSDYATQHPYQDSKVLEAQLAVLRLAGLPS